MLSADKFIRAKLRIPPMRPEMVERPRLAALVQRGLRGGLTVIAAPAGFGKTTLTATAARGCGLPTAWLSLDAGDNRSGTFLAYLAAALQPLLPGSSDTLQLLESAQPVPDEVILTSLVNALDEAGQELLLVLDDYHVIHNPVIHARLAFVLEHAPRGLHMLIASRSDPPLPLTRLRARGQVLELRAADLRFTVEETAQFVNDRMGLNLPTDAVRVLEQRTEGWAAGLQMAALSLRDRVDITAFLDGFSGTHRYILDYLVEEVLAVQPAATQEFLLHTAVLERLSAPLCAAVFPNLAEDAAAAMLAALDRDHLFVYPLDDDRRWYRYHQLFADLLKARLEQAYPGLTPELHRRAAAWLEGEGMTVEAINHALAAGDHDHAARMVEQNTTALLVRGELNALTGWIAELPEALRRARPWLCIQQAYALAFAGQLREIPALLAAARSGQAQPDAQLLGAACAVEAMSAVMLGQDEAAVRLAIQARELLPAGDAWNRAAAAWALGYAQRSLGHLAEARSAFEEQIRLGRKMGNIWTLVSGMNDLAMVHRAEGKLAEARDLLEAALREAAQQGARGLGYLARMESGLAAVLYEQNELDAALALLNGATAHLSLWPNPNHQAYAHAIKTRVLLAKGERIAAGAEAEKAAAVVRALPLTRVVQRIVETAQVALAQAKGDLNPEAGLIVQRWQTELDELAVLDESADLAALAMARVWLANGEAQRVKPLMLRVIQAAQPAGRVANLTSAYLLAALAAQSTDPEDASAALGQALLYGQRAGFTRLFLDEGPAARSLLVNFLSTALPGALRNYAKHLLAQFPEPEPTAAQQPALPELLSAREMEVLALLAQGATNQEIAARLVLAPGTVKAHTASIYRKLDAPNRTAAVAKARELRLLD